MLNIIIFSKNRSCQLELLLRSIKFFFKDWNTYHFCVLYTHSDLNYRDGYENAKSLHPEFTYVCENDYSDISFKDHTLNLVKNSLPYTVFFVDDNVFRQQLDLESETFQVFKQRKEILCLSLRLSPEINYCYAFDKESHLPNFNQDLIWNWRESQSQFDWAYPMSLDGHIFRTSEIKPLLDSIEFNSPNSLESNLASSPIDLPKIICFSDSKIVNIPANRVQNTHENRHGSLASELDLNQEFLRGKKISLKTILDAEIQSVHQEIPLQLQFYRQTIIPSPVISVIVICHNQAHSLLKCIENLLAQEFDSFEIVIVDDSSADNTRVLTKQLINTYSDCAISILNLNDHSEDREPLDFGIEISLGKHKLAIDPDQDIASNMLIESIKIFDLAIDGVLLTKLLYRWNKKQATLEINRSSLKSKSKEIKQKLNLSSWHLSELRCQLQNTQSELQNTQSELQNTQSTLNAVQSSKFWKLREKWFALRKNIGIKNDNVSLTPKYIFKKIKQKLFVHTHQISKPAIIIEQDSWDNDKPLVSVVIPCFNYGKYVEEAIDSVLNQTFNDIEIIVVDDGSTDRYTIDVLDKLNKPKTKLIRTTNQKLPAARNNGIKEATGKYICCLDADDLLKPTYLEKCLIKLESEKLDICYSWLQEFGNSSLVWPTEDFQLFTLLEHNCVIVSAVFTKIIWEKTGGYDESMILGYEDWDFWIRISKLGGLGGKINEALFLYRKHGTSMIDSAKEKHDFLCNKIQNNHPELYSPHQVLNKSILNIFQPQYIVKNPYSNLVISYQKSLLKNEIRTTDELVKIRILFVLPWLVQGGVETVLLQLIKHLRSHNIFVSIITTLQSQAEQGDTSDKFYQVTQEIYHLPKLNLTQEKWLDFIRYFVKTRRINLVSMAGSDYFYSILSSLKNEFQNLRVVDQLYNTYGHIKNNRKYSHLIDLHIVENKNIKDTLIHQYFEQETKLKLIRNGIDINYFNNDSSINLPSTIPKNRFVIIFLGRLSEEKAPDLFIKIADYFKDNSDVYFIMGGEGLLLEDIRQQITRCQLEKNLGLLGCIEPKMYLQFSDLLILPSRIDGRPNAVLESLSMGVPVIASSVGGLPEIIRDGYNGFLCQPSNVNDFVDKIKQVLNDKNLHSTMKKNARNYAVNNLNIQTTYQEYLDTFASLIKK